MFESLLLFFASSGMLCKAVYLRQGGNVFVGFCLFVCLFVSQQDNSKSYGRIFLKF